MRYARTDSTPAWWGAWHHADTMPAPAARPPRRPDVFAIARRLGYSLSAAGRALQAKRLRVRSVCLVCRVPMVGLVRRSYCSAACRGRAFRRRRRGAQPSGA